MAVMYPPGWRSNFTAYQFPKMICRSINFCDRGPNMALTLLHTSDWHLGHTLHRKRRDEEFRAFLSWLEQIIADQGVDVLLVAGDIFDTSTPGTAAQKMYYDFLAKLANTNCRHIVLTAGNHDSPSFLDAPSLVLRNLSIHIVSSATTNPADEVIVLKNAAGDAEAIIAAVPYLREKDVREFSPGEEYDERRQKLAEGIENHYRGVAEICRAHRQELGDLPIVAMGHLYASGASPYDGADERELYIGTLYRASIDIFPPIFDYVALGHIHRPQIVGGNPARRYSGAPLPMSFAEAGNRQSVTLLKFRENIPDISEIPVPSFRCLRTLKGSCQQILDEMANLAQNATEPIWLEILHDGSDAMGDVANLVCERAAGTPLEVLCVMTERREVGLAPSEKPRSLSEYSPEDIFRLCLEGNANLTDAAREELLLTFRELQAQYEDGKRGE